MKATQVHVKTFTATSETGLDAAIQSFLDALGEAEYLGLAFAVTENSPDVVYAAQLTYTT